MLNFNASIKWLNRVTFRILHAKLLHEYYFLSYIFTIQRKRFFVITVKRYHWFLLIGVTALKFESQYYCRALSSFFSSHLYSTAFNSNCLWWTCWTQSKYVVKWTKNHAKCDDDVSNGGDSIYCDGQVEGVNVSITFCCMLQFR